MTVLNVILPFFLPVSLEATMSDAPEMPTGTTSTQTIRAIVLWSWPRTRSTVFERFFLARPARDVDVQHEAMGARCRGLAML